MKRFPLFSALFLPRNFAIFLSVSAIFFGISVWILKSFPSSNGFQCLPAGAAATPENLIFAAISSGLFGIFAVGIFEIFREKFSAARAISSAANVSIAGFLGAFSLFCPVCTIGVVSIFGASFGLEFFVDFNFEMKIATIFLLLFGIFWTNSQMTKKCQICQIIAPK